MDSKKNPEVDIEKKRNMLFSIGLLGALAFILIAFEWAQFERSTADLGQLKLDIEEEEMIPITQQEPPPPPPPPPPQTTILEIVEDDEEIEEEIEIEDTEADESMEIEPIVVEEEEYRKKRKFVRKDVHFTKNEDTYKPPCRRHRAMHLFFPTCKVSELLIESPFHLPSASTHVEICVEERTFNHPQPHRDASSKNEDSRSK